jgi:hypothetical protein
VIGQGGEHNAHKEMPRQMVIKLRRFFDIALRIAEHGCDGGNNTGLIDTMEGQNIHGSVVAWTWWEMKRFFIDIT